jgi:chorismate mutase
MKIDDWRRKIDAIDTAMLHLLNLRAELALEVGRMKSGEGVPLRSVSREQEILTRMKETNPGPLDGETVAKIYQLILDESIRTQTRFGYSTPAPASANATESRDGRRPRSGKTTRR